MSTSSRDITDKPHTDADPDTGKPESPTKLTGGAWKVGLKRAAGEFSKDNCTDLAASLTYFAVLSLFPALLAVVSLLGVFGQGQATVDAVGKVSFDGVTGKVSFDEFGDTLVKVITGYKVEGGKFASVKSENVS